MDEKDYQRLIGELISETSASSAIEVDDIDLLSSIKQNDQDMGDAEYDKRNVLYTHLLSFYIYSHKRKNMWKTWYKAIFLSP